MSVLEGKVAIVTGSARGIGRATAELLSQQGAKVLINDLDGDVAEETAKEVDGETIVFAGDLTKDGACDKLVEKAIGEWGQVDILVNNAGYTIDAPIHKMSDENFQRMLDIHSIVPFRMCRAVAPHMREPAKKEREEGREVFRKIVNVSSISGTMGNAGQANYSSGKSPRPLDAPPRVGQGGGSTKPTRLRSPLRPRCRPVPRLPRGVESEGDRWRQGVPLGSPAPRPPWFFLAPARTPREAGGGGFSFSPVPRGPPPPRARGGLHPAASSPA